MKFNKIANQWLCHSLKVPDQNFKITQMKGATSSSVFLIQCDKDRLNNSNNSNNSGDQQHLKQFILRMFDNKKWLKEEHDLLEHETAALNEAEKASLKAPKVIAFSAEEVGFGAPVLIMSFVEGKIDLQPIDWNSWLEGLAKELCFIHQHKALGFPWRFKSWVEKSTLAIPKWTTIPKIWESAIELILKTDLNLEPDEHSVFIHRDYHPTNVLWHHGTVSGVVDWINACLGPAGVDVAHCRTNLTLMFGQTIAERFLKAYIEARDIYNNNKFVYDPLWDIHSILDMCLPNPSFYKPWQEFGLKVIPEEVLKKRVDTYLESVMVQGRYN